MELLIQIPEAFKWSWIRRNTVSFNKKIPLLKEKANKQHFLQTFGALLWLMTLLVWNHWNSQFPIFHCKEPITKLCVCVCPMFSSFCCLPPPPRKKKRNKRSPLNRNEPSKYAGCFRPWPMHSWWRMVRLDDASLHRRSWTHGEPRLGPSFFWVSFAKPTKNIGNKNRCLREPVRDLPVIILSKFSIDVESFMEMQWTPGISILWNCHC